MKALSIKQPWVYAITHLPPGIAKRVENREWKPTNPGMRFRGTFAIHASQNFDRVDIQSVRMILRDSMGISPAEAERLVPYGRASDEGAAWPYALGAVVATARLVEIVREHPSPWFFGPVGLVFDRVELLPKPIPAKGRLGFWEWSPP